ncbi:hypothetical protein K435DRAFT_664929 [Dendrothele bispora CBS 962.96]|uniref:Fungal-type protein kinase domain-containing protein n=1 Tax=Dendrothele bispora (strain CBS 962.96) TaxID=1314807 RepID=A0A4V4HFT5_DENBC|nr:hypothetical protein K435DRAFT_664929 [Dendrothele bispora CBS 962.96]
MRNDARRRFVFGLTMEDTKIRLWFHDRAVVLASEAFDLHRDWRQFVHILVALGTADRIRLGYDDTVSLVQIHEHANTYDITVFSDVGETTTYRTIERISDYGTDILTGRGTRVWKVRKMVKGELEGPFLVLKDSWISNDPQPEHVILNDVRQSLSAKKDPRLRHFLTRAQAGLVPYTRGDRSVRDHTLETQGHQPFQKKLGDINTIHRLHYRIVFQEVGRPLSELGNLDEMFFTLQGALRGLGALHDLGYIHRDISPHNVLLVVRERQPTNCKSPTSPTHPHPSVPVETGHELVPVIMDLEYTVKASSNEALRHLRTGTWHFMATEVLIGCWNFPDEIEQKDDEAFESVPHFRQHALHDIEPIFWMAIWVLFKFGVPSAPENFSKEDYKTSYCKIFPPAGDAGLPTVYHVFIKHLRHWYADLQDTAKHAYVDQFPHMDIVKIGESSQQGIQCSIAALQSIRDVIAENPNLQERVTSVNTILDPST